jgi:tetratricopeptide (TPR) repeat protein
LANAEAIRHLRSALDLVGTLPEDREHHRIELELQIAIGVPLASTRGWSHPDYEAAMTRARELVPKIGDLAELQQMAPGIATGLAAYYLMKCQIEEAAEFAQEALIAAERTGDAFELLWARCIFGELLYHRGRFSDALNHLERSIGLYDPSEHGSRASVLDGGVFGHIWAGYSHFILGHPDRALVACDRAVALARRLAQPFSLVHALFAASLTHFQRGELERTESLAEEVMRLAEQFGSPLYRESGRFWRGCARVGSAKTESGMADIQLAAVELSTIGTGLGAPMAMCQMAEGFRRVEQYDIALGMLETAIALAEHQCQHFYDAELYRVKAEVLLDMDAEKAEALFHKALEVARRQEAKAFELRGATGLARLWQRQDKQHAARALLGPVYTWFSEGFETRDLRAAKTLLDELR